MIAKCNVVCKLVVTATQVLESMAQRQANGRSGYDEPSSGKGCFAVTVIDTGSGKPTAEVDLMSLPPGNVALQSM